MAAKIRTLVESGAEGPGIQRDLVVRRRLLDRLDGRFQRALTTIEAGAGFGKTSLMHQAITEAAELGRGDEVVVACGPQGGSGRGYRVDERGAVIHAVARRLGCEPMVESVADAVLGAAPQTKVLWIDDVHHVEDGTVFDDLLAALPANGHLVLLGRRLPRLTTSRLESQGQVLRFGEEDLRFDLDERAAFLHLRGAAADSQSAQATSGWPAVMELELAAGRSGAADYLTEEVLGELSPERLAALRALCPADVIDEGMLRAVTDYPGSLNQLVAGIPLVSELPGAVTTSSEPTVDDQRLAFHDLLREALLADMDDTAKRDVAKAVAAELLRRDDLAAATARMVAIDDLAGLGDVAQRLLHDLHVATHVGDRTEAVDAVCDALGDAPVSLALRAVTMAMTQPVHAEAALQEAIAVAEAADRFDLVALCTVRLADYYYGRSEQERLGEMSDKLNQLAAVGQGTAKRMAFQLEIWALRLAGREAEIVDRVDEVLADSGGPNAVDDEIKALTLSHRTLGLAYSGRLHEALAEVDHHTKLLPEGLFSDRMRGFATIQLWMLGEQSEEVRNRARRLVDQIESRGQSHLFVEGAATTAIFAASVGELASAEHLVERAERGAAVLPRAAWSLHSLAQARAVVRLLSGDEAGAAEILDAAIPAGGPLDALPCHIYGLTAALSYVLVPRSRPAWEEQNIGGDLAIRLAVARALVAFREEGKTAPAAALPWSDDHLLRPWAFGPHLAELAVAAVAGGNRDAEASLTDTRVDAIEVLERLDGHDDKPVAAAAKRAIQISPRRPTSVVELGLLGPISVRRAGVEEADSSAWRRARVRDLVSLLAYNGSMSRQAVAAALWPDKSEKAAQNNLRSNLSYLLNALEPGRSGQRPSWFITSVGDTLGLEGGDYLVLDVDRFESLRASALALDSEAPRKALARHLEACDLYRGDLLSGSGIEESAYFDGLRHRGDFKATATRAADLLVSIGEPDRAEGLARRAAEVEPLHEPAQRALVASLFAQRRFGAARDVLGNLLSELSQLGIPPEPETAVQAERLGMSSGIP
jgi:DNA-binding SARP family transcriptional activator